MVSKKAGMQAKMILMKKFSVAVILLMLITLFSCSRNKDDEIYDPTGDESRMSGKGGIYDIGASADPGELDDEGEYQSPFGPKPIPSQIAFAPSLSVACKRAAADKNLKVMMWVVSDNCVECDRIEKEIFTVEAVRRESTKYIWVRFNVDTNPERKKYYLQDNDPPALIWFDKEGDSYHRLYGGFDDAAFIAQKLLEWH